MKKLAALFLAVILGGCAALEPALEPPSLSLTGIRVLDVSLFEQRFVLNIRMQNPNPVELPVTGMNIQLDINEVEFGRGVSNQAVTVSAYGETVFEITLVSNVARLVDQIRTLESGKGESLRYRLAGGISVANRLGKLPFDYHGEIGQQR
jgi:LEA14-like dessication related protein